MLVKGPLAGGASVLVACALAGCSTSSESPGAGSPLPTESRRSAEESEGTAPAASAKSLVFGPIGVGRLRMGMTHQQVSETDSGRVYAGSRHDGWRPGCRILQYDHSQLGRTPGNTLNGVVSDRHGLELLYATPRMVTPEGIRLGSTLLEVRDAYARPELTSGDSIVVPASGRTVYRIQVGDAVTSLSLQVRRPDCII
jgi:hypothetical protein